MNRGVFHAAGKVVMPRRNVYVLLIITLMGLACAAKASRHGRQMVYAMDEIKRLSLEPLTEQQIFEGALQGMMSRLDDYSVYISPQELSRFQEELEGEFGGVGIEMLLDQETKDLVVVSPLQNSPALRAGIRTGDKIVRIDGKSTQGLSLEDARERMRGQPGEPVKLGVLHLGETEPVDIEIERAVIQVDTVVGDTRSADGSWNFFLEGADRIGYVRIDSFAYRTDEELERALKWLVEHKLRGLILDLRNNPGGRLDSAINICDLFIEPTGSDRGEIVSTRGRDGETLGVEYATPGAYRGFPMVVLVNQLSASASEIVAACLQDHGRAVVVGQRSYGKGTIQQILDLEPGMGQLKLTTASYWRPSGRNIHRTRDAKDSDPWGVSPDAGMEVKLDDKQLAELAQWRLDRLGPLRGNEKEDLDDFRRDPQLARAVEYLEERAAAAK
jgi:carboxyl-terminal processing protease